MRLSGAEGEELTPALALYMGVFDPIQSPIPVQGFYPKAIAQKAYEAQEFCELRYNGVLRSSHGALAGGIMPV